MRLVVAEDNALLRDGLIRLLEAHGCTVVLAVDNATALTSALRDNDADGAVLDVRMPPTFTDEGLKAAVAIRAERPGFPVMVLSQYVEQLYARELLASGQGAIGYLLKDRVANVGQFVDGVRRVVAGGTVIDPEVIAAIMARHEKPVDRLTPREQEVLALLVESDTEAAIADTLGVSAHTVRSHVKNLYAKLQVHSRAQVVRAAYERGLV